MACHHGHSDVVERFDTPEFHGAEGSTLSLSFLGTRCPVLRACTLVFNPTLGSCTPLLSLVRGTGPGKAVQATFFSFWPFFFFWGAAARRGGRCHTQPGIKTPPASCIWRRGLSSLAGREVLSEKK